MIAYVPQALASELLNEAIEEHGLDIDDSWFRKIL
jgi:hypothetical protein